MLFSQYFYNGKFRIGGPYIIVEIDESNFGKRKYNRGRLVEGVWVSGAVERLGRRQIFLYAIEKRDAEGLNSVITSSIKRDYHIYSDMWRGYSKLKDLSYKHSTVNHSENLSIQIMVSTQTQLGVFKVRNSEIRKEKKHIIIYLIRYMILRNLFDENYDDFLRLLLQ
ncbi:hypothetical protein DMUE_4456 [Dictyocoela muelleri]|nr:hypothetical protein DMUE_4456 [Dictyocoela muelleri]